MNVVERARRHCQIAIKAYHNIHAAHRNVERLIELVDSDDALLLCSLFLSAVVRYGRPFSQTKTQGGSIVFPIKPLKKVSGFQMVMHDHLLRLRNRLLAHDDLEEIAPPILFNSFQPHGSAISIPIEIHISNKALGYPADLNAAVKIRDHIAAALQGAANELDRALSELRAETLANPALAEQDLKFNEKLGTQEIPVGGARLQAPNLSDHPHLSAKEPDFSSVHNGYHYEPFALKKQFWGPEKIKLENGGYIEISPPDADDQNLLSEKSPTVSPSDDA